MAMMSAYINVENWSADQVAAWLRGLDDVVLPYVHFFLNNVINGRKLLMLSHGDLEDFGITKLGHQELILEAVDLLRALHYGFDTENLQSVTLQLGCKAKSLHNELQAGGVENDMNSSNVGHQTNQQRLPVAVLSSVADILSALKVVVSWLDRAPFESMYEMCLQRNTLVKIGIDLITVTQKDHSRQDAEDAIMKSCSIMTDICDEIVIQSRDPLVIQPTSLELATIRKKPGDELGLHIQSSYFGIHAIGGVKELSPAFLCGKIEKGDEVISVNHQIVVGWQLKKLVNTLKEKPKEVVLLLKKRPVHINPFGNVPNKKKLTPKQQAATLPSITKRRSRDGDKQQRPSLQEFVSVTPPPEEVGFSPNPSANTSARWSRRLNKLPAFPEIDISASTGSIHELQDGNDTDNEVFRSGSESPKFKLEIEAKPRRATVSGGSPTLERPALIIEDLDAEGNEASAFSSPESGEDDLRPSGTYTDKLEVPESPLVLGGHRQQQNDSDSSRSDWFSVQEIATPEQKRQEFRLARNDSQKSHKIECPQPIVAVGPPPLSLLSPADQEITSELPAPVDHDDDCNEDTSVLPTMPLGDKRQSKAVREVAGAPAVKNQPMLMKIRKLDSTRLESKEELGDSSENTDSERQEKDTSPEAAAKDSSYTVTIVGGVIQKMPTGTAVATERPTPPESPVAVMRRHNRPAKRMDRRVSCKDLGKGDCEGWLYKKKKSHTNLLASKWHKRWFVLKNYNLYYYKHQDDLRAEGVIHLPSFKVSPDTTDMKGFTGTRKMYAFKVYNTGTAFYFASDRAEDMTKWMNKMGLAAITYAPKERSVFYRPEPATPTGPRKQHAIPEDADYSESDEESEAGKSSPPSVSSSPPHADSAPVPLVTDLLVESQAELTQTEPDQSVKGNNCNSDKADDYTSIMRSLEKADLTIDGTNFAVKRRSAITSQEVLREPPSAHSHELNRIVLLERTLKSKELLVEAIDRLLQEGITRERLKQFKENYPDLADPTAKE